MKISVVIPVKNGAYTLDKCLRSIKDQTLKDIEIIILDSGSADRSIEIANRHSAKIIPIHAGTFDHGLTRNTGAENASGDLIFLTVQDAWIAEKDMLEKMAAYFADENIKAVTGHQAIPHEADKNPLRWYKRFSEPITVNRKLKDIQELERLDQKGRQGLIAWDNVVAMYRKEALLQLPFIATEMSEDWVWSRDALLRGWTLIYDPSLIVYHYHHETYKYTYRVSYSVNYHFYKFFGFTPALPAIVTQVARATWHIGKNKDLTFSKKIYWISHNYKSLLAKFNANFNFLWHLKFGGARSVQKRYTKVCKTIPQGTQNIKS